MKGLIAVLAAFSSIVSAAPALTPWQGPAKFYISITATINDPTTSQKGPATYYLSNRGDGSGTLNKADAAECNISTATELMCSTNRGSVRISSTGLLDMIPMTSNGGINTGFSVDRTNALHWESKQFMRTNSISGKAKFALYPNGGNVYLYADLGCPTDLHFVHKEMIDGNVKVTPVERLDTKTYDYMSIILR